VGYTLLKISHSKVLIQSEGLVVSGELLKKKYKQCINNHNKSKVVYKVKNKTHSSLVIVQRRKDQANIEMHFSIISQTLNKASAIREHERGAENGVGLNISINSTYDESA
jgi:hypothetical protein